MKKVHGREKRKFCIRAHLCGAKEVRKVYQTAIQNISKLSKKK